MVEVGSVALQVCADCLGQRPADGLAWTSLANSWLQQGTSCTFHLPRGLTVRVIGFDAILRVVSFTGQDPSEHLRELPGQALASHLDIGQCCRNSYLPTVVNS